MSNYDNETLLTINVYCNKSKLLNMSIPVSMWLRAYDLSSRLSRLLFTTYEDREKFSKLSERSIFDFELIFLGNTKIVSGGFTNGMPLCSMYNFRMLNIFIYELFDWDYRFEYLGIQSYDYINFYIDCWLDRIILKENKDILKKKLIMSNLVLKEKLPKELISLVTNYLVNPNYILYTNKSSINRLLEVYNSIEEIKNEKIKLQKINISYIGCRPIFMLKYNNKLLKIEIWNNTIELINNINDINNINIKIDSFNHINELLEYFNINYEYN